MKLAKPFWGSTPKSIEASRYFLWADLHLSEDEPEQILAFCAELRAVEDGDACVIILGDLFDAYLGPKQWAEPAFLPLAAAFQHLLQLGVSCLWVRGNRDALARSADLPGLEVEDALLCNHRGHVALLSHGDEYCLADLPYQRLRRFLRFGSLRAFVGLLPYFLRKRIAKKVRSKSKELVPEKPLEVRAITLDAVSQRLSELNAHEAWIGHLHQAHELELESNQRLFVLDAWSPGMGPRVLS